MDYSNSLVVVIKSTVITLIMAANALGNLNTDELEIDQFQEVNWELFDDIRSGISISYPYHWQLKPKSNAKEIFSASDTYSLPAIVITAQDRPQDISLKKSGEAAIKQFPPYFKDVEIISDRETELSGFKARELIINIRVPVGVGIREKILLVSVYDNNRWIIIRASDASRSSDVSDLIKKAVYSTVLSPSSL